MADFISRVLELLRFPQYILFRKTINIMLNTKITLQLKRTCSCWPCFSSRGWRLNEAEQHRTRLLSHMEVSRVCPGPSSTLLALPTQAIYQQPGMSSFLLLVQSGLGWGGGEGVLIGFVSYSQVFALVGWGGEKESMGFSFSHAASPISHNEREKKIRGEKFKF